eukprot:3544337-Rhodomonas_salina.2
MSHDDEGGRGSAGKLPRLAHAALSVSIVGLAVRAGAVAGSRQRLAAPLPLLRGTLWKPSSFCAERRAVLFGACS